MRFLRTSALLTSVAAAAAFAADDPWRVSAPPGPEHAVTLVESEREYTLMLAGKPWEGANGPERVELALSAEEKDALTRCRAQVDGGELDAAQEAVDGLLGRNPANWDAWLLRARVLHARESDAEALSALRTSLVGNRRSPEAWQLLEELARALGKKVVRPRLALRGWVRELGQGEVECGHVADDSDAMPWSYYAAARAVYRYEGPYARDFPGAAPYRFTFREQMYAMGVLAASARDARRSGTRLSGGLKRVLSEDSAGSLVPFTYFAVYPEAVPALPEPGFDALLPRLERYFDQKVLVRR